MSLIADGLTFFNTQAARVLEDSITYSRVVLGIKQQVTFGAIPLPAGSPLISVLGMSPGQIDMGQPNPLNDETKFSFQAALLIIPTVGLTTPLNGDQIVWTPLAGVASVYEVNAPVGGGLIWQPTNLHSRILVNTKFLRNAP
jgi:hypothetical protein